MHYDNYGILVNEDLCLVLVHVHAILFVKGHLAGIE